MLAGIAAIMRSELTMTARRPRYYVLRLFYGLILLVILLLSFRHWETIYPNGASPETVARFAEDTFIKFGHTQSWMILVLVPAMVAGVIADEHQRKTLHYLLASRLSSTEIILGKLGARLAQIGVFVAIGLPIVCLLSLYGALNPQSIAMVYGTTLTTALFLAGLSMLISTLASKPRDALFATFGLVFLWLVVPPLLAPWTRYLEGLYGWVGPVNDLFLATNPTVFWSETTSFSSYLRNDPWLTQMQARWWASQGRSSFVWMLGLQSGLGLLFLLVAIIGLRPFRGNSWPGSRPQGLLSRFAGFVKGVVNSRRAAALTRNQILMPRNRPSCGEHPMFWKECFTPLGGGLSWLGSRTVAIVLFVILGCILFDSVSSLLEMRFSASWSSFEGRRRTLGVELQTATWLLSYIGIIAVAAAAAVSITAEREHDTWTSLATTLISASEVVRAKQFGAVWSARWIGALFLVLWSLGLVLEVFTPQAVLAACLLMGLALWLTSSLGVFVSPRAGNSTRAQVVVLLLVTILVISWLPGVLWEALGSSSMAARSMPASPSVISLIALSLPGWLIVILSMVLCSAALSGLTVRYLRKFWA